MKFTLPFFLVILGLYAASLNVEAQSANDAKIELQDLVEKVKSQLKAGKKSEADFAPELKEFDALIAEHKTEKTDDVAQISVIKAMFYGEYLHDARKGIELLHQVKQDYPGTKTAESVDEMIESLKSQEEAEKIQKTLVERSKFPDFDVKDLAGEPLSIARYKGKILLLDFWATWCPPCVHEVPNVVETYKKYHGKGFDVIGISLDQEKSKLTSFIGDNGMAWPQYFHGQGWQDPLVKKYGIRSIPATFLLDGEGRLIAKDLRGEELMAAVAKALAKK
jgi:thiol-disulfide isomerase/thioredoxin